MDLFDAKSITENNVLSIIPTKVVRAIKLMQNETHKERTNHATNLAKIDHSEEF